MRDTSLREAIERREAMDGEGSLCSECNLRGRYGAREIARVAVGYVKAQMAA